VIPGHQIFGAHITNVQLVMICVSLILFTGMDIFLGRTAPGRSIRAVAGNPVLCNLYGISSTRYTVLAFAIGSGMAAIAGILYAMDTAITPAFGFDLLLYGVVAMIIGGTGSSRGLLGGALLVAAAQHLAARFLDTQWMNAVTYLILIFFLIWRPLGFSGKQLKKTAL
jgi:branched-chain amino acid transport system permease protein